MTINEKKDEAQELINNFNEVSKNAGTVAFKIKYTAIPSNRKIHKDFAEFCFEEANNNYLSGLNILLKYSKIFDWLDRIEERLTQTETNMNLLRDYVLQSIKEENKNEKEDDKKSNERRKPKTF